MTLTVADLTGYVERDLDADVARWLAAEDRVVVPASTRPVAPFAARLSPADAAALTGLDRRVRAGAFPQILDAYDWSYGFDFAANGARIVDSDYETELIDDDVFAIGADGGGNYLVVLTNGQVAVWFHEEEVLEADTRFDNLDVFIWSMVRFAAVRAGTLPVTEVEADFRALAQPGAVHPEFGLLTRMKH
ncbi:hypothetical protein J2S43_005259 [Catenuloplanes nepalensis]|uniref:Knr4/Smi1-like domain-containing protein n=1 Tax=Catenuloplanes nepalensis TaxID=587533 RepID=A0ABT9MZ71_9ACTN|nr:hypothetical protein [Catenuloplanes nepalensis]MDP9796747.1 hypothetical protein [Catenuloplanes nepalensis]